MFKKLIKSDEMRQRVSLLLFFLLVIPFGLFFSSNWMSGVGRRDDAGTLFGKRVSREAFDEVYRAVQRQWQTQVTGLPEELLRPMLTQSTWDKLMMLEEARRRRVRISDDEVAKKIREVPVFQENGQFARARYELILRSAGLTPRWFEESVRSDMTVERLIDDVKHGVTLPDEELDAAYREAHEEITGSMLFFDPADFTGPAGAVVTPEAVRARYEAQPDAVRRPEQLRIEYAGVSREELSAKAEPTEDQLARYHAEHPDEFQNEDGTPKSLETARDAVRDRVKADLARQQFNTLVMDLQDDRDARKPLEAIAQERALTVRSVGPLPLDAAANALPDPAIFPAVRDLSAGMVSDVVETERGAYLARVAERIPSAVPPLEEVQEAVRARLVQEEARRLAGEAARAFRTRMTEQAARGLRFEEVVAAEQRTPIAVRFTRTQAIPPAGYDTALNKQAFALQPGQTTDVVETSAGFVILRPEERIPADMSRLAEERETFRQGQLAKKQETQIQSYLAEVRARAQLKSFLQPPPGG